MSTGIMVPASNTNAGEDELRAKRLQLSLEFSNALAAFANAMLSNQLITNNQVDFQASASSAGTEDTSYDADPCSALVDHERNPQYGSLETTTKTTLTWTYSDDFGTEEASQDVLFQASEDYAVAQDGFYEGLCPSITLNDDPTDILSVSNPDFYENYKPRARARRSSGTCRKRSRRFELVGKRICVKFEDGKVVVFKADTVLPEINKGERVLNEVRKIWELKKEFAEEAERRLRAARAIDVCVAKFARFTEMLCDAKVTLAEEILQSSERGLPTRPSFTDSCKRYHELQEETEEMRQALLQHFDNDDQSTMDQERLIDLYFLIEQHGAKYKGAANFVCKLEDIEKQLIKKRNKIAEDYWDVTSYDLE